MHFRKGDEPAGRVLRCNDCGNKGK
ncbi:hypothetical protein [Geobacter sp. Jerry-YX]|uniref:TFIIS-type domain-containing protein n=1 Tax=Geobacter benzoatilyticus TaxID=2815309 RepID=A0ABX7Q8T2_9BACT|nr:hypothetical protein JZM60_01900 [Geobacter benzoatilyticus]